MTFGSLFAGIGGIDLGLERAGMECRWQVECDPYCLRVLARHWPGVQRYTDVRDVGAAELAGVDLIAGGFPCQDISQAGRGAGLGGERSGLWWEFARVVRELAPRYVLVENVAALLGRGLDAVLGTLASLGYDAEWHCIPAAAVGAPHQRDRIFIVARHSDADCGRCDGSRAGELGPDARSDRRHDSGGLGTRMADTAQLGRQSRRQADAAAGPGGRHPHSSCAAAAHSDGQRRPELHAPAEPIIAQQLARLLTTRGGEWPTEPGVGRVADGVPRRVDRLRGLGNAVVPQVAEVIGRAIMAMDGAQLTLFEEA